MVNLIGKTLNNFKFLIEEILEVDSFSVKYKARELATNELVVIKTLKQGGADNPDRQKLREEFKKRARRLCKCQHSNIVRYRSFFEEYERYFLVTGYIRGSSLDKIVGKDNPLSEGIAINCIKQVAPALKVIHSKNLLHLNIKPENLIFHQAKKEIVLIGLDDFPQKYNRNYAKTVEGAYRAIEQELPNGKLSPATDVYGLAATLYTLLTAEIPRASTLSPYLELPSPKDLLPRLSQRVSDGVMAGMAIERSQRPATVSKWLAGLE